MPFLVFKNSDRYSMGSFIISLVSKYVSRFITPLVIPNPVLATTYTNLSAGDGGVTSTTALTIPSVPTIGNSSVNKDSSDPDSVIMHKNSPSAYTDETANAKSTPNLQESYNVAPTTYDSITSTSWSAMTFTPQNAHTLTVVRLPLGGTNLGTITVSIRATSASLPSGSDLVSSTLAGAQITNLQGQLYDFGFGAGTALSAGVTYAIVVRVASGTLYWYRS